MNSLAYKSHKLEKQDIDEGRFKDKIVPLEGVSEDEGQRRDTTLEKMAGLRTLVEGGRLTAAVSSQISDASAAMLIVSERGLKTHNLTPRARIHHLSVRADDPIFMLSAPIPATKYALE